LKPPTVQTLLPAQHALAPPPPRVRVGRDREPDSVVSDSARSPRTTLLEPEVNWWGFSYGNDSPNRAPRSIEDREPLRVFSYHGRATRPGRPCRGSTPTCWNHEPSHRTRGRVHHTLLEIPLDSFRHLVPPLVVCRYQNPGVFDQFTLIADMNDELRISVKNAHAPPHAPAKLLA
jgi:hypothetical protein